jgi:cystathionine beta-synthase
MADPAVVLAKKAKIEEGKIGCTGYDLDEHFAKFRPDKDSRCTWTKDSCPKDSPHIHNDNM